jgi:hypothetical protein
MSCKTDCCGIDKKQLLYCSQMIKNDKKWLIFNKNIQDKPFKEWYNCYKWYAIM